MLLEYFKPRVMWMQSCLLLGSLPDSFPSHYFRSFPAEFQSDYNVQHDVIFEIALARAPIEHLPEEIYYNCTI